MFSFQTFLSVYTSVSSIYLSSFSVYGSCVCVCDKSPDLSLSLSYWHVMSLYMFALTPHLLCIILTISVFISEPVR